MTNPKNKPCWIQSETVLSLGVWVMAGVVLAHIIHHLKPDSLVLSRLNTKIDLSQMRQVHSKALFEVGENLNMCVDAAKKLKECGVVVVNLGANDILDQNVDIVLGLCTRDG
jgi:hypothetical protein